MSRTLTIDGVDYTSQIRLADFAFTTCAYQGQVGAGNLLLDDTTGTLNPGPMKAVEFVESAATSGVTTVFHGLTAERAIQRGPLRVATQRQWDLTVEDMNTILDDAAFAPYPRTLIDRTPIRPPEPDVVRARWAVHQHDFDGLVSVTGSKNTAWTGMPNTNTNAMGDNDYRGLSMRDVLDDCAEQAGKNYYLYYDSNLKCSYDTWDATTRTAILQISDDPTDVDNVNVFAPDFGGGPSRILDPQRVYSTIRVRHKNGQVSYTDLATRLNSGREKQRLISRMSIKDDAGALKLAKKVAKAADSERDTIGPFNIHVPAAAVTDAMAGQRVQIKLRHAGITSYTYYRIKSLTVMPRRGSNGVSATEYTLRMELRARILPSRFGPIAV